MKEAIEQYFPVVLFIMLYKKSVNECYSVTIQMKAVEEYFLFGIVCFSILRKSNFGTCFNSIEC